MASSNDSLSPLAERLLSRSGTGPRIGAGSRLFERLGLQNPYEGGAVADQSLGEDRFSFLSSEAYFSELRGLSYFRSQLLGRIGRVRSAIRAHERFDRTVGTVATRALRLGLPEALEPTLVDWSTQLEATSSDSDEIPSAPRERPERRQSAAERALRGEIASASKVLEQLQRVASMSRNSASRKVQEQLANLSQLAPLEQADAAQRLASELRGVSAIASRNTDLARTGRGRERNGSRALSVAQRRQDGQESRGLQRVLDQSPVVMELERPADHPEVERTGVAARRPRSAPTPARNHRDVPVARAATEARSQASVGRAGPPAVSSASLDEAAPSAVRSPLRPTARVARTARKATNAPLFDTRRGLRHDDAPVVDAPANRIAQRMDAGVVSSDGSVLPGVSWARDARTGVQATTPVRPTGHALADAAPTTDVVLQSVDAQGEQVAVAGRPARSPARSVPSASSRTVGRRVSPVASTPSRRVPALARAVSRPLVDADATSLSAVRPRGLRAGDARESRPLVAPSPGTVGQRSPAGPSRLGTLGDLLRVDSARSTGVDSTGDSARSTGVDSAFTRDIAPSRRSDGTLSPDALRMAAPADAPSVDGVAADRQTAGAPRRASVDGDTTHRPVAPGVPADGDASRSVGRARQPAAREDRRTSALEQVVSRGSRRNRARPTIRAASRALAQERSGARGRMLAPSATAHVAVATAQRALSDAPMVAAVSGASFDAPTANETSVVERLQQRSTAGTLDRPVAGEVLASTSEAVPRTSRAVAAEADLVLAAASDDDADVGVDVDGRITRRVAPSSAPPAARSGAPSNVVGAQPTGNASMAPAARLANTSRAVARAVSRERTGETGSMLAPRSVAPFRQEPTSVEARMSARQTTRLAPVPTTARGESGRTEPAANTPTVADRVHLRHADGNDEVGQTAFGNRPSATRPTTVDAGRVGRSVPPAVEAREGSPTPVVDEASRGTVQPRARRSQLSAPTELTLARATDDEASTEATGLASRASRRGRQVAEVARRSVTQPVTPEQQQAVARRVVSSALERSETFRTGASDLDPARTTRTPTSDVTRSSSLRTPDSVFANARSMRTEGTDLSPASVHRTRGSDTAVTTAIRGQRGFVAPARVVRTSGTVNPSSMAWRTRSHRSEGASVGSPLDRQDDGALIAQRGLRTLEPAAVAAARHQDPVAPAGQSLAPHLDPVLLDSVFDHSMETPVAESGLGRAMRRAELGRDQISAMPTMGPAELVLAQGLDGTIDELADDTPVGRVRPSAHALARSATRREAASQVARPTPSARTAHATMQLVNQPGLVDGVLLAGGEAVEHESVAGGRARLHRTPSKPTRSRMSAALDASAALGRRKTAPTSSTARGFEFAMPADESVGSRGPSSLQARLDVAHDGTLLGVVVDDAQGGSPVRRQFADRARITPDESVASPMEARRQPRSARLADDSFVPLTPDMVADPRVAETRPGMTSTLDALVRPPTAQRGGPQRLMRRRTWNRRSMAAELGVQTPTLAGADFVPEDQRLDGAPAWARRAGKGTSAQASSLVEAGRPERETNGLMGALARAERPDEIVKVIIDRRTEIREVRGEVPQEAVRLMQRISEFSGAEAELLRSGQRVMAATPEQNMLQSRSMKGGADITQLSAGTNGLGATRVMKLADKLMGLIHLAENSRQKDAQDQVRMAKDSLEARAEGGAKFPGLSVEDHDMNIEQLRKSVLESVMEAFEDKEQRSPGEQDGGKRWF